MSTAENEIFGMYDYFGQGIIDGWSIHWMGCLSDPYVLEQRQALLNAYRTDPFSYLALEYQSLNYPVTEADWQQCIVVTPGLGIIQVYHAATEVPSFFRFTTSDHFYVWAQKNVCTNTEYLCEIIAPAYPDEDYDLSNPAIYIGEVFTNTVNSSITITQITYSERRRELKNAKGEVQRILKQALISHVHTGEGDMPSKINLSTNLTISINIVENSNTFTIVYPEGFNSANYATPQVYLNSYLLLPSQYQISGNILYLQNSVNAFSTLQIVYELAPGPSIYITSSLTPPLQAIPLNFATTYYLTDGTTRTTSDGTQIFNVWSWVDQDYSFINVYLGTDILDRQTYNLYQLKTVSDSGGRLQFNGPILPSITNYYETDVVIKFVIPSLEVVGKLDSNRIQSINANSFKRGTVPNSRIIRLDHLGLYRIDEPATTIPYKKLLDSGDHVHFYPVIDSLIQHSDYIIYSKIAKYIKEKPSDSTTLPRTIISTPNGLFATKYSAFDFSNIISLPWNTDIGLADEFSENYFGNFITYQLPNVSTESLNPKMFWALSKSKNQFQNVLYLSTNYGQSFRKISLPTSSNNTVVTINDFLATVEVFQYTTGEVILTPHLDVRYIYYIAAEDGLYSAILTKTQNKLKPIWVYPSKTTTDFPTGSLNKITEAVNVGEITTSHDTGLSEKSYTNYRNLYIACDNGLFVYDQLVGTKFISNSSTYNTDNSSFNFVDWLGSEDSSNTIYGIVWGDSAGCYYSNSGQKLIQSSTGSTSSTYQTIFNEPLTLSYDQSLTVECATISNLDLNSTLSVVDSYTLNDTDQVLVKNQTILSENGIYIYSSAEQKLFKQTYGTTKLYVLNGSQAETEWIELQSSQQNPDDKNYALWYTRLFELDENDYVVSVTNDKSSGPGSNGFSGGSLNFGSVNNIITYYHSFFVATTKKIYRILNYLTPNIYPTVQQINWDYENNGLITSIQHYNLNDPENGELVVMTENGIFRSTTASFTYGPVDSLGNLILPNNSYIRFINTITASQADNACVYNAYDLEEYTGKILSVDTASTTVAINDGTYLNQKVFANNTQGSGFTVDITISSGAIQNLNINNPGVNYGEDIANPYIVISNQKIQLSNAVTQGFFTCNYESQYFVYSKSSGINPSELLYEVDFTQFYISPWTDYPLVTVKINNTITNNTFGYNSELGQITFAESLPKALKNAVTVSLSNKGQYISNAGETPHNEVFGINLSDAVPSASISSTYYPSSGSNILPIKNVNNSYWNNSVNVIKVTGQRAATTNAPLQNYTELIQVSVDTKAGVQIFIKSKPTTLPLPINSNVYVLRPYDNILGIEDKIFKAKSGLTYHMDSVSHENVYTFSNTLTNIIPDLYDYPVYSGETLTGVDRGLQNTIYLKNLSEFDPSATFIGYSFGVDPSQTDIAAAPTFINLILDFSYGNNPLFATDKGVWQYIRSTSSWARIDTVNNSNLIYFANKTLTDSNNQTFTYAGTNTGLYYQVDGTYTLNPLFEEPVLSLNMGSWFSSGSEVTQRYEAYGKENSLSFVLRSTNTKTNITTLASDYFDGHKIYDIYYNTFYRYNDKGERSEHPAIYLSTDFSVWAFTTSVAPNAPGPSSRGANHTLLVGREMFGDDIVRTINKLNPSVPGVPAKVFKILEVPSGGRATWLAFATSNGVYVSINWKQCDVGDPNGLTFYRQNKFSSNATVGHSCFVIIPKSTDNTNSTYFVGTEIGVFKSTNKCFDWKSVSKFNGADLSVSDLEYFFDTSGNGYLIAATNIGLWISDDDGDTWSAIEDFSDSNIQILTSPTYGVPLSDIPTQTFNSLSSGMVSKVFAYINPQNLTGISTLFTSISNGTATTVSFTSVTLDSLSYPGMYGFAFTNMPCSSNTNYSIGFVTDNATYATQLTWGLSNLQNPYLYGTAKVNGQTLTNKDFFFKVSLDTSATPTEIIEPVGFYNNNYPIGFASGDIFGASISSTGWLYSNIGILCNVVLDTSKSFEINDTAIITTNGVSTSYVKNAVINSLVPNGIDTNCLSTRLSNESGVSKFLASIYGYNNTINDLLFYSSSDVVESSSCFSSNSVSYEGYTNNTTLLHNSIDYVSNSGRLTKLYDAMLFNSRLQYPNVVNQFYRNNTNLIDTDYVNTRVARQEYKADYELFLSLQLIQDSGLVYNIFYGDNSNNFVWKPGSYEYSLVIFSDGTSSISNFTLNPSAGQCIFVSTPALTPTYLYLSKDWVFDTSISDLSLSVSDCFNSEFGLELIVAQYAKSFKPLIMLTTDGNDDSTATPEDVDNSLTVSWMGKGSQVLVIEPDKSGNEADLRDMIKSTNSSVFKYASYPENELKSILFEQDNLSLFTSTWTRSYDFDSPTFISYIFAEYQEPSNSKVIIKFKWSSDRSTFSNFISLPNGDKYYLNQKVLSISYDIYFKEDYENGARVLPSVSQLYHVQVIPATQTYLTYPQDIYGQMFETLASGSFTNNNLVEITPIVGRTNSADTTYYEQVQLNRNSALPNRQQSFRITPAETVTGLLLLPLTNEPTNSSYYVVDNSYNLYPWTSQDEFILFNSGVPVAPTAYNTIPESAIVLINNLYSLVGTQYLYESFTAQINYSEKRSTITGEPTTTYDFRTYYCRYGRFPIDANVVVLVNQQIYKGIYSLSPYDGTVTFGSTLNATDYVTVFIQFANTFRAGLQIDSYSASNLSLQSFNFTHTTLPNLPTYIESFQYVQPILIGSPVMAPSEPNLDNVLNISYEYFDELNATENGSNIIWWRQRTGIEYVTFDPSVNLNVTGSLIGLNTFTVQSLYNQNANPFILNVTTFSASGVTTNIVDVVIQDRGSNFIGTGTNLPTSITVSNNETPVTTATISNIGGAMTAHVLTTPYTPGYATTDNFVRINPLTPGGYVDTVNGISGAVTISAFPDYDGRLFELSSNVSARTVFDGRDTIYALIQPSNGVSDGIVYQSNSVTMTTYYTPVVSNLTIIGSISTTNGFTTSLSVYANTNQTPSFAFSYPVQPYTQQNSYAWYKLVSNGTKLLSNSATLSSSFINPSDQIYYTVFPGVIRSDGTFGSGTTTNSDIYTVI